MFILHKTVTSKLICLFFGLKVLIFWLECHISSILYGLCRTGHFDQNMQTSTIVTRDSRITEGPLGHVLVTATKITRNYKQLSI